MKQILDEPFEEEKIDGLDSNGQMSNPYYKKAQGLFFTSLVSLFLLVIMATFLFSSSYSSALIIGSYLLGLLTSLAGVHFNIMSFKIKDGRRILKYLLLIMNVLISLLFILVLCSLLLLKWG